MTTRLHQSRDASLRTTSTNAAPPPTSGPQTVRRNLFSARASRRPVRSGSTTSSSAATTVVIENPLDVTDDAASSSSTSTSSEILVRNASGDYAIAIPSARMLMDESHAGVVEEHQGDDFEDEDHLLELLRTRTRQSNEQELLDAVRLSLKRKVEALVEDEWMFHGGK